MSTSQQQTKDKKRKEPCDEATVAALLELGNSRNCAEDSQEQLQDSDDNERHTVISGEERSLEKTGSDHTSSSKRQSVTQKERWNSMFNALLKYQEEYGSTLVPFNYDISGTKLGRWVNKQRSQYNNLCRGRSSQMTEERVERLESMGFEWSANPLPALEQWDTKWELLRDFHRRFGHTRVPHKYEVDGVKLGQWVSYQRNQKSRKERDLPCEITMDRIEKFDSLGFEWKVLDTPTPSSSRSSLASGDHTTTRRPTADKTTSLSSKRPSWEEHYKLLARFRKVHGNTRVPLNFDIDGVALGEWVCAQRHQLARMKKGLPNEIKGVQIDKLNDLGFEWSCPYNKRFKIAGHPMPDESTDSKVLSDYRRPGPLGPLFPPVNPMAALRGIPPPPAAIDPLIIAELDQRRLMLERARMMEAAALGIGPADFGEWSAVAAMARDRSVRDMIVLDRMAMREQQMRMESNASTGSLHDSMLDGAMMYQAGLYR